MFVIDFSPPMSGIEGIFNTFRLGVKWAKILNPGDTVLLIDKKRSEVIGSAEVGMVVTGKLQEMALLYAAKNHNQKGLDADGAAQRLTENMIKRYGPQMCCENSKVVVIELRRLE